MRFRVGKHVRIDVNNPEGIGVCDRSGQIFNHKDLVRQMEWRGNALVWTGLMVGRPYLDEPNPQNCPPILDPDPVPFLVPRPPKQQVITWSENTLPVWDEIQQTWESLWTIENGVLALPAAERVSQLNNIYFGA